MDTKINSIGNYYYSPYGDMNRNRVKQVDLSTNENKDVKPPKEKIPNQIIKVDSQSYMVFSTYDKHGNFVTL